MAEEYQLHDSGERETFQTGAVRDTRTGKGRYDLIPAKPLHRLAILYQKGSEKYADRNWEKGMGFTRVIDSLSRHLNYYKMGMRDEDHLAAIAWNAFALMFYEEQIKLGKLPQELDDIPGEI